MSFLSNLAKALGFGPEANIDNDPLYADTTPKGMSAANTAAAARQPSSGEASPVVFDSIMQDAIFEKVVEVFNASLPAFLARSVDEAAQRRYLRESLDEGINNYLNSLKRAAEEYCEQQWKVRQNDMAAELEAIRTKAREVELKSNDIRQKQLSADRQKRALTERVHELESQLAKLSSEREQFELENRSLMSRLKASGVMQEDLDKMNAELTAARNELQQLRDNPDILTAEREAAHQSQIAMMEEGISSLKEQVRVADGIRDDMRRRLREAEEAVVSRDGAIAERDSLLAKRDAAIADLKKENDDLRREIESLQPAMVMSGNSIDFDDNAEDYAAPRISEEDLSAMEASFETARWDESISVVEEPTEKETKKISKPRPGISDNRQEPEQLSLF